MTAAEHYAAAKAARAPRADADMAAMRAELAAWEARALPRGAARRHREADAVACLVPGCPRRAESGDLCRRCRAVADGAPTCCDTSDGPCEKPAERRGRCLAHYFRWYNRECRVRQPERQTGTCGCTRPIYAGREKCSCCLQYRRVHGVERPVSGGRKCRAYSPDALRARPRRGPRTGPQTSDGAAHRRSRNLRADA